jgi:hypothetical protein
VVVAYIVGFLALLLLLNWHPGSQPRGAINPVVQSNSTVFETPMGTPAMGGGSGLKASGVGGGLRLPGAGS